MKFFKYERKLVPSYVNQIKAKGFTSFYHFFLSRNDNAANDSENDVYILNAKVHKGHPFTHEYKTNITFKLNEKKTKQGWSESQQTEAFSVASLLRKENFVLLTNQKEEEGDQENNQHQQIFLTKQHYQKEEEED